MSFPFVIDLGATTFSLSDEAVLRLCQLSVHCKRAYSSGGRAEVERWARNTRKSEVLISVISDMGLKASRGSSRITVRYVSAEDADYTRVIVRDGREELEFNFIKFIYRMGHIHENAEDFKRAVLLHRNGFSAAPI